MFADGPGEKRRLVRKRGWMKASPKANDICEDLFEDIGDLSRKWLE